MSCSSMAQYSVSRDLMRLIDLGGERVLVLEFAALDAGNIADGADQMLVHRVVVVHVELHQRHGMAEFRHEAAQHAGLVHPAQSAFGIAARGQNFQKQPVGIRIVAQSHRRSGRASG